MKEALREFFGFGGYTREPDGAYSWKHLLIVAIFVGAMIALGLTLGLKNRKKGDLAKNRVLVFAAILIDALEIFKIVILCINDGSAHPILTNLPLFLCSIQLIALPVAAFSPKGRVKESAIDFVLIFGLLGGVLGIVGAAQNYNAYPAFSFDNLVSAATHSISGFASIYIAAAGLFTLKKKNYLITNGILFAFAALAMIANELIPYNYMFLKSHDGTPYSIFYDLVNGNKILYPATVIGAFVIWIFAFYGIKWLVDRSKKQ